MLKFVITSFLTLWISFDPAGSSSFTIFIAISTQTNFCGTQFLWNSFPRSRGAGLQLFLRFDFSNFFIKDMESRELNSWLNSKNWVLCSENSYDFLKSEIFCMQCLVVAYSFSKPFSGIQFTNTTILLREIYFLRNLSLKVWTLISDKISGFILLTPGVH